MQARPIRLGGPIFLKSDDPGELARSLAVKTQQGVRLLSPLEHPPAIIVERRLLSDRRQR